MPLLKSYIEFAGIHSDLFFASEGTASPNSTSALVTGRLRQVGFRAAGAAALIPSSAKKRSGSSSRSFKAIFKGACRTSSGSFLTPDAQALFVFRGHKNRKIKSKHDLGPTRNHSECRRRGCHTMRHPLFLSCASRDSNPGHPD